MSASPDHYSYRHYADPNVAEGFDELRFGGPIGRYLLESQQAVLLDALAPVAGKRVIDVGTGTGRAAIGLAQAGAHRHGRGRIGRDVDGGRGEIRGRGRQRDASSVGDAHAVPLADRSFDAAVCLRVLMHAIDWRRASRSSVASRAGGSSSTSRRSGALPRSKAAAAASPTRWARRPKRIA